MQKDMNLVIKEEYDLLTIRQKELEIEVSRLLLFPSIEDYPKVYRFQEAIAEITELKKELISEYPELRPIKRSAPRSMGKKRPKITFAYKPQLKEVRTTKRVFYYGSPDASDEGKFLPAIFLAVPTQADLFPLVAYLRQHYPHLTIEQRLREYSTLEREQVMPPVPWYGELKLTNADWDDLQSLISIHSWNHLPYDTQYSITFCHDQFFTHPQAIFCGSDDIDQWYSMIAFTSISKLNKWLNFLRRGDSIAGNGSFLASALISIYRNIPKEEQLIPRGKYNLILAGLIQPQVDLLRSFDFSLDPSDYPESIFDQGDLLSPNEEDAIVSHQVAQPNY